MYAGLNKITYHKGPMHSIPPTKEPHIILVILEIRASHHSDKHRFTPPHTEPHT